MLSIYQSIFMVRRSVGLLALLVVLQACLNPTPRLSHRAKADQLAQDGHYTAAIDHYRAHIQERLEVKDLPEWENPYLYYLDIGDVYLKQNRVADALRYYELAEKQGVELDYINDRIRYVASWHEQRGELRQALEHLKQYRERDPLLYDLMLDRLAKQIVREEELQAQPANQ